MFDSLKSMAGMASLLKDMPRIKAKIAEVRGRLSGTTVEAESGGGAVRAIVTGDLTVRSIRINESILKGVTEAGGGSRAFAEELIAVAVNSAMEKAREMVKREMMLAAEELDLPIPPGVLTGEMGGFLS